MGGSFSAKKSTKRPATFFSGQQKKVVREKIVASQSSTGLVELVVDMDSALFRLDVLLRVSGVDRHGSDVSPTLLSPSSSPL